MFKNFKEEVSSDGDDFYCSKCGKTSKDRYCCIVFRNIGVDRD